MNSGRIEPCAKDGLHYKEVYKMKYKVSVIIPIYGVEKFIGRCAETLMQQTLKEVEYIFVNDATPDCSMKVIQEVLDPYPERQNSVVVAVH